MAEPNQQALLADFLKRHVTDYDAATDVYERPPFAADIKEGKNDSIYNAHSYHTKVPPRSIVPYIMHYTQAGDLVLDPFCGSGMTGVAAQLCSNPPADILAQFPELGDRTGTRACVLVDLAPAACHIAYNYNTPVNLGALRRELERIKDAVKEEFDWLYGTEHYEPAVGLYDPSSLEVVRRLKNAPASDSMLATLGGDDRDWELVTKDEVEARLGYPVHDLARPEHWGDQDVSLIMHWICIPAIIQYTVWSDVYRCEGFVTLEEPTGRVSTRGKNAGKLIVARRRVPRGCGRPIVLWDAARNHDTGEVDESFKCPSCQQSWVKTQLTRINAVAVATNYTAEVLRVKARGSDVGRVRLQRRMTALEKSRLLEIETSTQPHWVPTTEMDTKGPRYRRSALQVKDIRLVTDFWTRRNLRAFAALWAQAQEIRDVRVRSAVQFLLTSFVARVSRKAEYRVAGGAGNSHNLIIPSITREDNVLKSMLAKEDDVIAYFQRSGGSSVRDSNAIVLSGSATLLDSIPSESIDYIFTDPPFGSNIYYSEANILWESWLGQLTDSTFEAVVHRENDGGTKRLSDYAQLMNHAIAEMFRVLKPGRYATIEFNNSDGAVFEVIKTAVRTAGFEIANMLLLDKKQRTFFQMKGASGEIDTVDKDVLFNLRRPAVVRPETVREGDDLEQRVVEAVRRHLETLPGRIKANPTKYTDEHRTTATINSMLMNTLIPLGVSVQRLNLPFIERTCSRYFRRVGQHWYLRGEPVGVKDQDRLFDREPTITDELSAIDWLRYQLRAHSLLLGEIKPLWMRATGLLPAEISQRLVLEDLLVENFWRDRQTNRWREPTEEERAQMNDDHSLRVLHDAERFVAGALRRETTDEERCDWINVLFRACRAIEDNEAEALPSLLGFNRSHAYALIPRLFQSVLRERVSPEAYGRAEKQTRAASGRVAREAESSQPLKARRATTRADQSDLDFES